MTIYVIPKQKLDRMYLNTLRTITLAITLSLSQSTTIYSTAYQELDSIASKKLELVYHVDKQVNDMKISHSIVEHALTNNIDICFMLAQSKIETNYGKTGIGKRKNSIFGIVSRRYSHLTESIEDYCSILTKDYLVNGKTEQHLLSEFVNKHGDRYAESREYEAHLSSVYHDIKSTSKIHKLQNEIILEKSSRVVDE